MRIPIKFLFILILFTCFSIRAQVLPPIQAYTPEVYGADNQNWSIAQTSDKLIYIANNDGLLEFNGEKWRLYDSPNGKMRSVKIIDDFIFTGCYREFGYWKKNELNTLTYTSLAQKLNIEFLEDEEFWNIIPIDDWILFQSLNRIYIYNKSNQSYSVIDSESIIYKVFEIKNEVYFQKVNEGLFKIEGGKPLMISNNQVLKDNYLVNIFSMNGKLLIETEENGFYILNDNSELTKWVIPANDLFSKISIYRSKKLNDGSYILGTRSDGIYHLTSDGVVDYTINFSNGLLNNSIHDIFEDSENNIWLALENGINCINIKSPFSFYHDNEGKIGTAYASAIHKGSLYIGTNQGLFYKPLNEWGENFEFIEGTEGPVWSLVNYDNTLFCGHNLGTFIIDNGEVSQKIDVNGTWNLIPSLKDSNILIQGNYDGLSVLEKKNEKWLFKNTVQGFNMSSRFFEIQANNIFVNHENKGVFKITINDNLTKAIKIEKDTSVNKGSNSSLVKYNDNILYAYKEGVYKYSEIENRFEKDSLLSQLIEKQDFTSGRLVSNKTNGTLWGFSKKKLNYLSLGKLSSNPTVLSIPFSESLPHGLAGYENISQYNDEKYLIGTSDGYIILDLDKVKNRSYNISINSIKISDLKDEEIHLVNNTDNKSFRNRLNNIEFNFSVPEYNKYLDTEYQYKLNGYNPNWSQWSQESKILFKNLPYGEYEFNVRARVGNSITENIETYSFTIERPWYFTKVMIGLYIIAIFLIIFLIHNIYKRYYRKQREKLIQKTERELELKELENKQQFMRFNNEKLRHDIDSKNRELGLSTMNIIKKNEFLGRLKKELQTIEDIKQLKQVITIIDKNLNNTDDWNLFEEAFNNADKDFLKKIKGIHPELTTNDLRLCAYLRLNLSSKEIAPLLNISPRSVEVKRYRLRKKMNLAHESSLTDYILEI
ncbi:triple tyrosine motif-containing protein [Seonamhaeicola maritimus]|uniref:LuxR family transcriptional regulator n=1 Tax=Seonamhaeicola maritimus TaxID=2591822 RepID=A0A5C7GGX4_9FLAO|nr:triple tyrosine motif-containing protein [Seonamhaeicola maritimus]TXG36990.1 LuxR family transcriptional regulator [Seonamhaeicola maritimus]